MSIANPPQGDTSAETAKGITAAEAASRVRRIVVEVVEGKDRQGNPTKSEKIREIRLDPADVLSYRDYGTHVVVVTVDGQKLTDAED
ncbi:hypothetical protein [Variovorax paradoxus]|uniref:Uncharacterized protein n=1 Tax=Variovorax paradoxus TaxID=34073 RepID=A0A0H2M657_VARPD|nr:hypothetical protein [Variovorax paradoxus]KLN57626.1 hypothetical protein VPARA_11390 [Variovorax paradoxus]